MFLFYRYILAFKIGSTWVQNEKYLVFRYILTAHMAFVPFFMHSVPVALMSYGFDMTLLFML